jgi:predicted RNase H-like HicB family nuclease
MSDDRTFTAIVRREDDYWLADVPALSGVHTFARTLAKLREYLADAIALWLEVERIDRGEPDPHVDRSSITIDLDVRLGAPVRRVAANARRRREQAAKAEADALAVTRDAARALTDAGLSQRDTAELLGLSHQRVNQLLRSA